jgi:hypothetical protein
MMLRASLVPAFQLVAASSILGLALAAGCGSSPTCESNCTASSSSGTGGADGGTKDAGEAGPTTFPCKNVTCMLGSDSCQVTSHLGQNEMGMCFSPPAACLKAGADCTCFAGTLMMGCMCQKEPDGTFAVFCMI